MRVTVVNELFTNRRRMRCSLALVVLMSSTYALAQVPSTLDPARIGGNLETQPLQRRTQYSISLPRVEDGVVPEGASGVTFVFGGVRIEGAAVLPEAKLLADWPHKAGDTVRVDEIFALAESISQAYREAGYALSFAMVPQQQIDGGVFRIQVVEGFVERVVIKGDLSEAVRADMQAFADRILASRPLRTADLERYLLLINDMPGVTASGVLSPAAVEAGAVLTLEAAHEPVAGSVGYNSFMPDTLGTHVLEASGGMQGVLTGSGSVSLTVRRSLMPDAYLGVSGDASVGIGTEGLRVGVSGLWSRIDPRDILLDVIDYKGSLVSAQLYGFYPIIRSREENLSIGASFSLDNDNSTILTTDFVDDRLRSVSVWGRYDFVDQTRAVTSLRGALTHGVDLFGATGNSRANGVVKYTKVELDAQRNQPLADVLGGALSLQATAHAQAALGSGALFSAPECSFGGRRFGRGFDSGILTDDHCAMGSVELHWVRSVDFPDLGAPVFLDFYAFVDGGVVWQKGEVLSGEPGRGHAASLGLGLSVQFTAEASGLLEVSRPVSLSVGTPDETRILGALSFRF